MSKSFNTTTVGLILSAIMVFTASACKDKDDKDDAGAVTTRDLCEATCDVTNLCLEETGGDKEDCAETCKDSGSESLGDSDCQEAFAKYTDCLDSAKSCSDATECTDESMEVTEACGA